MSLTPTAAAVVHQLPMSPYAYWAISFASFLLLRGVLWTFRNTASKYDTPVRVERPGHGDAQGSPRATDPGAHH